MLKQALPILCLYAAGVCIGMQQLDRGEGLKTALGASESIGKRRAKVLLQRWKNGGWEINPTTSTHLSPWKAACYAREVQHTS